ncbi:MAG TPA: hypothetical protein VFE26_06085 [Trebonia sp.]|nr:hypothetical protein [Trebonia sp.]
MAMVSSRSGAGRPVGSALAAAIRDLFGSPQAPANGTWPLAHPVPATLAWAALLLAVFVPLCTRRFART